MAFALDFVNTYDPMRKPVDVLADRDAAAQFLKPYLGRGERADTVGQSLIVHRDLLRAAFKKTALKSDAGDMEEGDQITPPELSWSLARTEQGELVMKPDGQGSVVQRLTAFSTIGYLALQHHAPDRLRVCQAAPCEEIFQDVTKPGRQKFCSKRCNTRFNVAQHRARERSDS